MWLDWTAKSHYLNQYWRRSLSPYGFPGPQWVNVGFEWSQYLSPEQNDRHCQMHFLEWQLLYFNSNFTEFIVFLSVQVTISLHWFKLWLGVLQTTSHYLNWWWPKPMTSPTLGHNQLTHLLLNKMAAISQTIFWNAFSWMINFVFWLKFNWSLLLKVQLTIRQQWFRWWLGAEQATSHHLNQCWPSSVTHMYGTRGRWVNSSWPGGLAKMGHF